MSLGHVPRRLREVVQRRAGGLCEYCRYPERAFYAAFNCEHCLPERAGGRSVATNLAWARPACNGHKGDARLAVDPQTRRRIALFNPRRDDWETHFRWSDDFRQIVGRTSKGRATAARLKFNRPKAIYLRALLMQTGLHPASE
jgi:hypothetical protein